MNTKQKVSLFVVGFIVGFACSLMCNILGWI